VYLLNGYLVSEAGDAQAEEQLLQVIQVYGPIVEGVAGHEALCVSICTFVLVKQVN
jgi:hypothetical protein